MGLEANVQGDSLPQAQGHSVCLRKWKFGKWIISLTSFAGQSESVHMSFAVGPLQSLSRLALINFLCPFSNIPTILILSQVGAGLLVDSLA